MKRGAIHPHNPRRTRAQGAALLMAMLIVVLVATLSSAVLWQQWRAIEVAAAQQTRTQAQWMLYGALDWARLILSEDGRKGGADHLSEPWAVPLAPARLSTFLASNKSDALEANAIEDVFLSGQIVDLQARLNVRNLVRGGHINPHSLATFSRLFALLGLPQSQLEDLSRALLAADIAAQKNPTNPTHQPSKTPNAMLAAALWPEDLSQLEWLGVSRALVQKLRPFVTILPEATQVNLNTAPVQVLAACIGLDMAQAQRWHALRLASPWKNLAQVRAIAGRFARAVQDNEHSVHTHYFQISGTLQIGSAHFTLQSVVQREGTRVRTLSNKQGAAAVDDL